MNFFTRFFINLTIFVATVVLLTGCASGPSAEPPACRGTAFQINAAPIQTSSAP